MINSDNWSPWNTEGCLTDLPSNSQVAALGEAIGKTDYEAIGMDVINRFPKTLAALAVSERHLPDLPDDAYPDESILLPAGIMPIVYPRSAANDNYPRLIALTGAAGSGKSTAANYLVEHHGYARVRFAGPLKAMMRAVGFIDDDIEGERKETPSVYLCGKTPRHAMQTLGTEWGRKCIGEDFWTGLWKDAATAVLHSAGRVVVDDCRFPNEAEAIHALGGKIIKITGRGGIAGAHASEAGCGVFDGQVTNDGCVTDLYAEVEQEVRRWAA